MSFTTTVNSVFDAIKTHWQKVDLKKWAHDIGGSSQEAVLAAFYFLFAFAGGFLSKRYYRYIFGCLIMSLVLIKVLEYNSMVTVNWSIIQSVTGIDSTASLNTLANTFILWIKNNIFLFGAALIGFLLGYRLG